MEGMKEVKLAILSILAGVMGWTADIPPSSSVLDRWVVTSKTDALTGAQYTEFMLLGKFIQKPRRDGLPVLTLRCSDGKFQEGTLTGGFIISTEIVDANRLYGWTRSGPVPAVPLEIRTGNDAPRREIWTPSENLKAGFFNRGAARRLLITKQHALAPEIVIRITEYVGGQVDMHFDLPQNTDAITACGLLN